MLILRCILVAQSFGLTHANYKTSKRGSSWPDHIYHLCNAVQEVHNDDAQQQEFSLLETHKNDTEQQHMSLLKKHKDDTQQQKISLLDETSEPSSSTQTEDYASSTNLESTATTASTSLQPSAFTESSAVSEVCVPSSAQEDVSLPFNLSLAHTFS